MRTSGKWIGLKPALDVASECIWQRYEEKEEYGVGMWPLNDLQTIVVRAFGYPHGDLAVKTAHPYE